MGKYTFLYEVIVVVYLRTRLHVYRAFPFTKILLAKWFRISFKLIIDCDGSNGGLYSILYK